MMDHKSKKWMEHEHVTLQKPMRVIAEENGIPRKTIEYWMKTKHKIATPRDVRYSGVTKYHLDHEFFSSIETEEQAYWLGFIVADGSVIEEECQTKRLVIILKAEDKPHLQQFLGDLACNAPIESFSTSIKGYGDYDSVRIRINSTQLCDDLIASGVHVNKSTREHYPTGIPKELERHFWRGFVDGDGHIRLKTDNRYPVTVLSAVGSHEMIYMFHRYLSSFINYQAIPRVQGKNYTLTLGANKALQAIEHLYGNASIALKRKYHTYESIIQFFYEDIV